MKKYELLITDDIFTDLRTSFNTILRNMLLQCKVRAATAEK